MPAPGAKQTLCFLNGFERPNLGAVSLISHRCSGITLAAISATSHVCATHSVSFLECFSAIIRFELFFFSQIVLSPWFGQYFGVVCKSHNQLSRAKNTRCTKSQAFLMYSNDFFFFNQSAWFPNLAPEPTPRFLRCMCLVTEMAMCVTFGASLVGVDFRIL